MWESRLSGSERGWRTTMERMKHRTPPENRMVDKENKTQPRSMGASSLLEKKWIFLAVFAAATMVATLSFADTNPYIDFQYYRVERVSGPGGDPPTWTTYTQDLGDSGDDGHETSFTVYLDWDFPKTNIDASRTVIRSCSEGFC